MGRFPNIAAAKAKTGAARGKLYGMYAKEIYLAAKNGGVTPEGNPSLKRLIEKAKKEQVPSDVIKRAIDKVNSGVGENYEVLTYEVFGPSGSTMMVECLTDNVNRTVGEVRHIFDKYGGNMGTTGSVSYMFENKGVLIVERTVELDEDTMMELVLDSGAEDVITMDDCYEIRTAPQDFSCVITFHHNLQNIKNQTYIKTKNQF